MLTAVFLPSVFLAAIAVTGALLAQVSEPKKEERSGAAPIAQLSREVRDEIEKLSSKEPGTRAMAAARLGEMGAQAYASIPALVVLSTDSDGVIAFGGPNAGRTTVGAVAIASLKKFGEPGLQVLMRTANSGSMDSIGVLVELGEVRAIPIFEKQLHSTNRLVAAKGLLKVKGSEALESVVREFVKSHDESFNFGYLIQQGLPKNCTPAISTLLIDAATGLEPKYDSFQNQLLILIAICGDRRATPVLVTWLKQKRWFTVVDALGDLGDPGSVEPLIDAWDAIDHPQYPISMRIALKKLTGQDFSSKQDALKWWSQNKSRMLVDNNPH